LSLLAKAAVVLAGFLALLALAWMLFLPAVVQHELCAITGFNVRVAVVTANPFTGHVVVRGLSATNPPGYPRPGFAEVRSITADMDLFSRVTSDRIQIRNLDMDIDTIEVVRRHDGRSNAVDFAAAFRRPAEPAASKAPLGAQTHYRVKRLHLRLDRLIVADFTGSKSYEKTFDLKIDETFTNVVDARQLLSPDVVARLRAFGFHHDLSELLPGEFGTALADAVGGAGQIGAKVRDTVQKAGGALKGLVDKLDQSQKP
jgi:hypothetical protein